VQHRGFCALVAYVTHLNELGKNVPSSASVRVYVLNSCWTKAGSSSWARPSLGVAKAACGKAAVAKTWGQEQLDVARWWKKDSAAAARTQQIEKATNG
jgi:hypothetical protein